MNVSWSNWQLRRHLPNTRENSSHGHLNIGCARCGALVIRDNEIKMIRHDSIWTQEELDFVKIEKSNIKKDNKRNSSYYDIKCEICDQHLGFYYLDKFTDNSRESKLSFPTGKIFYLRQTSTGELFNKTVVLGDEATFEVACQKLSLTNKTIPST